MNIFHWLMRFLRAHPVATYYVVTFLISWCGVIIMLGGPDRVSSQALDAPFLPLYLITVAGPFLSGLLLTVFFEGRQGYRELLTRLCKWRVQPKWYLAALFIAPVSVFLTLFGLTLFSSDFLPGIFGSAGNPVSASFGMADASTLQLVLFITVLGVFNGFAEEIGWTGFVASRMKWGHHLIASGLNVGFMWGLWHLLSNYLGSAGPAGTVPLSLYIAVLLFSFLPPFRVLMGWVYGHTQSLLIGILMHASLDIFWILSMPSVLTGAQRVIWYITWAAVLWGMVALVRKTAQLPVATS